MSKSRDYVRLLTEVIWVVSKTLGFETDSSIQLADTAVDLAELLGHEDDRSGMMASIFNSVNSYVVSSDPTDTAELRRFIITRLPHFLVGYQSIRFPQIKDSATTQLPTKADLSKFPDLINETGLFVPVSSCLRLIAVSLVDDASKQELIDNGNVKAIVSHMVDDPLNPFQRESAIFVVNVLTRSYPPAQAAVSSVMNGPMPS